MPITIMIVEDEMLIGLAMEQTLVASGYNVSGPFVSSEEAEEYLAHNTPDAALLDINLGKEDNSFSIAEKALVKGVPFAFLSGYAATESAFADQFQNVLRISKPCSDQDLNEAIESLCAR